LIDEDALLQAAGNPNGSLASQLPPLKQLEELPDPKATLVGLLKEASGLRGRRLRDFREGQLIHRLAELIRDYTPLRQLKAFQEFEKEVKNVLGG